MRDVCLHGAVAYHQLPGDLCIRQPARDQIEDLAFARGEIFKPAGELPAWGRPARERLDDRSGDRRVEQRVSSSNNVDGGDQLLRWNVFEEKAARARAKCLVDVLLEAKGREHEDARTLSQLVGESSRSCDPVEARHADVHEDYLGHENARALDGLETVGGLPDHLDCRICLQDLSKTCADECLIVCNEDADAHVCVVASGRRARTTNPPPLRVPASKSPPYSATRSRIPTSPWPASPIVAEPRPSSAISSSSSRLA